MPAYEYTCHDCHHNWEIREHIEQHAAQHELRCPKCGGTNVEQVMTDFYARTDRKS